jgi:uncharacterized membrane protein (UPF0127 family)
MGTHEGFWGSQGGVELQLFSIDCVWLDEKKKIVWMKEEVRPFTLFVEPPAKAMWLIELPKDTIKLKKLKKKDMLVF